VKILLVSTAAIRTPPEGYGGMEREVDWLRRGILEMQEGLTSDWSIQVDLVAAPGSPEAKFTADDEAAFPKLVEDSIDDYDIVIDFSHDKQIGRRWPELPQINVYQVMTVGWPVNPVYISKAQRDYIGIDGPVIYYGIDRDAYPPNLSDVRKNYMLYIGSLIQEKRVHWVAEAAQILRQGGDNVRVIIAGPRWQAEYWPTLDVLAGLDFVTMINEVAGEQKLKVIQNAGALVHPVGGAGWIEAGAIIALEALTCGIPVIATPNGCLPEYIRPNINGFLVDSPQAIAMAYKQINGIRPRDCHASTANYDYRRMAEEYLELAGQVMTGKRWGE